MPAVALTDHGRAGGLLSFKKACDKHGVKPIYGTELYMAPASRELKERVEGYNTSYHLTILAKNQEGLKNVFRLSSLGWMDGFYYKPRVDLEALRERSEGLVVLSGCAAGFIPNMLMEERESEAVSFATKMKEIFGEDFYIELQDHGISWQQPMKEKLIAFSKKMDIPLVATQDSHFIKGEDADFQAKVCKLAAGDLEFESKELFFKSYDEMLERMNSKEEVEALDRTLKIADKCNCEWEFGETIWPVFELPEGMTADEELQKKTTDGFYAKFGGRLSPSDRDTYTQRLDYELKVIREMGFSTYFLVVADFIEWSKTNDIPVGPGRGSGAGSLVCYCIGITNVDPIPYGLYFERFLNPARVSLPDIDVDFCPRGRKDVMAYVSTKYGSEKVAQIGTYSAFKPRGSLRDFARVCGHEPRIRDQLAQLVPSDVAGFSLSFDEVIEARPEILKTEYPEVVDLARKAEGLRTKMGVHAAGVVVSDRPLNEQLPLFRGRNEEIATQFDMHDVEELGLVKYDFLGLINLTVIDDTIKLVKQTRGEDINLEKIDEQDEKVFKEIFQSGDLDGVFQFETSSGFRDLCVKVRPRSIDDLAAITALFRPGPLGTGLVDTYVSGRGGGEITYPTPQLEPILGETYGVMVFQEQIMKICTDLAGYTLPEADNMRKIIGKKLPEKMAKEKEKFVSGCVANDIKQSDAEKLFSDIEGFAKYSFNKSHSVAYSVISYHTAWLKCYYPEEFYCALFNNTMKEQDQLVKYIHSCRDRGISIEPPDINRSSSLFTVDHGTIMFGLAGIKGVGEKACDHLLSTRPEEGFESIEQMILAKIDSGTLKALASAGALGEVSPLPRSTLVETMDSLVKHYKKVQNWEERVKRWEAREQEKKDAVADGHKPPRSLPKPPSCPAMTEELLSLFQEAQENGNLSRSPKSERLQMEREKLGFYLSGHPLDQYPSLTQASTWNIERIKTNGTSGLTIRLPIVVGTLTKKRTRKGKDMAIAIFEDQTGRIETTIFPGIWKRIQNKIEVNKVGMAVCKVDSTISRDGEHTLARLILNDINIISDEEIEKLSAPIISDINVRLDDGSMVTFSPEKDTKLSAWQQAKAIADNLSR